METSKNLFQIIGCIPDKFVFWVSIHLGLMFHTPVNSLSFGYIPFEFLLHLFVFFHPLFIFLKLLFSHVLFLKPFFSFMLFRKPFFSPMLFSHVFIKWIKDSIGWW